MKLDLSNTFLNGAEDVTAALAPQTARTRWGRRAVLIAIMLPVVGYLVLIGLALRDQFRPAISPLSDGWFRVTDRDRKFEVELPASPSNRTLGSRAEYQSQKRQTDTVDGYVAIVGCDTIARQRLNNSAITILRMAMQNDAYYGAVTLLDSGVVDSKTQWIEYRVFLNGSPEINVMRRRLIVHDKQLLELTVYGREAEAMSQDVTRIMTSAHWLSR